MKRSYTDFAEGGSDYWKEIDTLAGLTTNDMSYRNAYTQFRAPRKVTTTVVRTPYQQRRRAINYGRTRPLVPRRSGFTRCSGFYGRFGANARNLGFIPEKKFLDTTLSFAVDSTAATATTAGTGQIDLIPQNDTESGRDGRQCTITSIQLKGLLTFDPAASADASGVTQIYVIQDTQTNGAQAAMTDVFTTATLVNMHNLANSKRFRVLKKFTHYWNPPAGATGAYNTVNKYIDWYKSCSIPLEFSANTGAKTEQKSNSIFLAYGSNSAIDALVAFAGIARIRFRG